MKYGDVLNIDYRCDDEKKNLWGDSLVSFVS